MSEPTKCACQNGWVSSELGGSVPCPNGCRPNLGILDALAAWNDRPVERAVRAETLREVRGVVEKFAARDHDGCGQLGGFTLDQDAYVHKFDLLTYLDALAHPEGTE